MNIFDIPDDCWSVIWHFSTYNELFRLRQTCHHFHRQSNIIKLNNFWKMQCQYLLPDTESNYDTNSWFSMFVDIHRFTRKHNYNTYFNDVLYVGAQHMNDGVPTTDRVIAACQRDNPLVLDMYLSNPKNHMNNKEYFLEKMGTNIIKNGYLLETCIIHGSFNCVKYLFKTFLSQLKTVLDTYDDDDDEYDENDIIATAMNADNYIICKYLVENLCKLKRMPEERINKLIRQERYERTLLHYACKNGKTYGRDGKYAEDLAFIKLLIDNGADLLMTDSNGCTPLSIACKCYNYEAIRLLLQIAKQDRKNDVGYKILSNAKERNKGGWDSIIFWLVKNVSIDTEMMEYILRNAIEMGLIDIFKKEHTILAEQGQLNSDRYQDFSPLTVAIEYNYIQAVKCLVSKFNVNVNRIDNKNVCFNDYNYTNYMRLNL